MTKDEFYKTFAHHVELERKLLNLTQKEMADALDISLSTYKRIINCEINHIDLYLSLKLYEVTQKITFEMVEYSDDLVDAMCEIKTLKPDQLQEIVNLVKVFKK